jgi:hypothetical protein
MSDEERWLTSTDPEEMLRLLPSAAEARKLCLFAIGCARRARDLLADSQHDSSCAGEPFDSVDRLCETLLATSEEVVDGPAAQQKLVHGHRVLAMMLEVTRPIADKGPALRLCHAVSWSVHAACQGSFNRDGLLPGELLWRARQSATYAVQAFIQKALIQTPQDMIRFVEFSVARVESAHQAGLLRETVGNPFCPSALDPSWRTDTVARVARSVYDDRRFDELPVLADALEDAGCTNKEILDHLRGPGPHERGCWALNLLLTQRAEDLPPPGQGADLARVSALAIRATRRAAKATRRLGRFATPRGTDNSGDRSRARRDYRQAVWAYLIIPTIFTPISFHIWESGGTRLAMVFGLVSFTSLAGAVIFGWKLWRD